MIAPSILPLRNPTPPTIHLVPMVATREGVLVPVNVPAAAIQHRPPLLPPSPFPPHHHPLARPVQPPVARLKPIPLSGVSDTTPASLSRYLKEDSSEETKEIDEAMDDTG